MYQNNDRQKVLHIVTGLTTGGAEIALYRLIAASNTCNLEHRVICLTGKGEIGLLIERIGICVNYLGLQPKLSAIYQLPKLYSLIAEYSPNIVHTWMYHADLLGGIAAKMARVPNIIWSIHNADPRNLKGNRLTFIVARLCSYLSAFIPVRMVSPSAVTIETHTSFGYCRKKFVEIGNGIDFELFKFDEEVRRQVRIEFGVLDDQKLVGMFCRFDKQKNHSLFFEVASIIAERDPAVTFILAGTGNTYDNNELTIMAKASGLESRCCLLGTRDDIHRIMSALDLYISTSSGESFSLVLLEALVTGVPCISTAAGDPLELIGEYGSTVVDHSAIKLSEAALTILSDPRACSNEIAHMKRHELSLIYSVGTIADMYVGMYNNLKST